MKRRIGMLKIVALITAFLILTGLLAGCKGSRGEDKDVGKIDVGEQSSNKGDNSDTKKPSGEIEVTPFTGGFGEAYWKEVIEEFEDAYPDIKVKFTGNPKLETGLPPRFVSGDVPDVVECIVNALVDTRVWGKQGLLTDLGEVLESETLDGNGKMKDLFDPGVLDFSTMRVDGKVVALPFATTIQGIWYNAKIMRENNWTVPQTWDEFFELGKKFKEKYGSEKSYWIYPGIYPDYMHPQLYAGIAAYGGTEKFNKCKNDEPGAWEDDSVLQSLKLIERLAKDDLVYPGVTSMNHTASQTVFLQGKAFMIPNGSWLENEMKELLASLPEKFEFGFMPFPSAQKGGDMYYISDYEAMYIPAKAKNPEAAKLFLKFCYTKDQMQKFTEMTTAFKPCKGNVSNTESVRNAQKVIEELKLIPIEDKLSESTNSFTQPIWEGFTELITKTKTAEKLHEDIVKIIKARD